MYGSLAVLGGAALTRLQLYELAERFRAPSLERATSALGRWCRWAAPWLRLQVEVHGQPSSTPCLYISNHRSYLDILVLAGTLEASFLSRGDVANWPIIGSVARHTGVVFVDRDDPRDRLRAARGVLRRLRGGSIVVFPEGTTTGAARPAPFPDAVFRLAQRVGVPIVPVTIRYSDRRAYWIEDLTIWQHLTTRVFAGPKLQVAVHIGEPLVPAEPVDAEDLTRRTYAAVCEPLERCGETI